MRILHTSDWHLGIQLHGISLLDDQRKMIEQLAEHIHKEQIDVVILAGDVFDHAIARPEAVKLYTDAMTLFCRDCNRPVLLCAGNHDGAERLSMCSALLQKSGLYIVGRLQDSLEPILLGDTAFFLLPYFNADEARALYPQDNIRGMAEAMQAVLSRLHPVQGYRNLLIGHCFVAGAVASESDRAAMVGGSSRIPTDLFSAFDYVALGHLHRAQAPAPNIQYSGSPLQYSFAEAGQQKCAILLDTVTLKRCELPLKAARQLQVLRGNYEALLMQLRLSGGCQDYLKIELTDTPAGLDKLEQLRVLCPNLLLLTGTTPQGSRTTLTVEQLSALSPTDLMTHFYEEIAGGQPDEEQKSWFEAALLEEE